MKRENKISSTFTAILAVLILFAATLSGPISNKVIEVKAEKSAKKARDKNNSQEKYHFTKASTEAVFTSIFPSFDSEAVTFLPTTFPFNGKKITTVYRKFFDRIPHLEILFEHLNAPNAP